MTDQNPLHVCSPEKSPASGRIIANRSGRPTMKNMIKFGPQPTSIIIAQILNERKTVSRMDAKDEALNLNDRSPENDHSEENIYDCTISTHRNNSSKEHTKHSTKHKQYFCDYPNCTYSCKISSNLIKHKRVHTNEKPFLCEKCCFRSNFVNSLKAHTRIHTAERPYQCAHCSYKCNSSSNLKKHLKQRHPDTTNCQCIKT